MVCLFIGNEQKFNDNKVLLLGEPDRDTHDSGWTYDNDIGVLHLDAFGDVLEFKISKLTKSNLVLRLAKSLKES